MRGRECSLCPSSGMYVAPIFQETEENVLVSWDDFIAPILKSVQGHSIEVNIMLSTMFNLKGQKTWHLPIQKIATSSHQQ